MFYLIYAMFLEYGTTKFAAFTFDTLQWLHKVKNRNSYADKCCTFHPRKMYSVGYNHMHIAGLHHLHSCVMKLGNEVMIGAPCYKLCTPWVTTTGSVW